MAKPLTADAVRGLIAKVASPVAAPEVAVEGDESAACVRLAYPSLADHSARCGSDHAAVSSLAAWRIASSEVDSAPVHHRGDPTGATVATYRLAPAPTAPAAAPASRTAPTRDA